MAFLAKTRKALVDIVLPRVTAAGLVAKFAVDPRVAFKYWSPDDEVSFGMTHELTGTNALSATTDTTSTAIWGTTQALDRKTGLVTMNKYINVKFDTDADWFQTEPGLEDRYLSLNSDQFKRAMDAMEAQILHEILLAAVAGTTPVNATTTDSAVDYDFISGNIIDIGAAGAGTEGAFLLTPSGAYKQLVQDSMLVENPANASSVTTNGTPQAYKTKVFGCEVPLAVDSIYAKLVAAGTPYDKLHSLFVAKGGVIWYGDAPKIRASEKKFFTFCDTIRTENGFGVKIMVKTDEFGTSVVFQTIIGVTVFDANYLRRYDHA